MYVAMEVAARMESSGTAGLAGQRWYVAARRPRATRGGAGPTRSVAVGHSRHGACSLRAGARDRRGWGAGKGSGSPNRVDWRRTGEGQGRRRQALGEEGRGHGQRWPETEKVMVKLAGYLAGERKTNGKRSNIDGFDKRDTLRWRERRDLTCGGGA